MHSEINFTPFPTLETERLQLRRILVSDAQRIFEMRTNVNVMRHIDKKRPTELSEVLEIVMRMDEAIENNSGITWAICLKEDPTLIGTIGFWRIVSEHFRAEVGYMLEPTFQQQGITHEALQRCISFAFDEIGIHSIEANLNPDNTASENLLKKNGFVKEGYFKENFFFQGKFLDTLVYSLVKPA